jgi:phage shock protein PspC (stress-responsive transcriptional regulator)
MKKTLTVNIGGMVFHIDEDAYQVLNNYLQSIRKHFFRSEGGEEIVSDIEARIAEMLQDRIGDERQVITIDDIDAVIEVIGQPSEFGDEFTESSNDHASHKGKSPKRLYRDPESSVLGGVCGGLGAYFHTDPVWFRLAFVLFTIIGIGTPLLIYVILWIVVPEAKTVAERLEMRGERVDISNIEKSIREEINNLKDKLNDFTRGARQTYKKKSEAHRSNLEGVGQALGRVAELIVKVALVVAGIFLFLFGLSFIIALLVMLFGLGHNIFIMDSELIYVSFPALVDFFIGPASNTMLFTIALLLLVGIPLFMLIYAGVRLIFGLERIRYVGLTAFNIWMVALVVSAYFGYKVVKSFSHTGVYKEQTSEYVAADRVLHFEVIEDEDFTRYYRYEEYIDIDEARMIITNDERDFFYGMPSLEVVKGDGTEVEVEVFYRARGKSNHHAEERASRTIFHYTVSDTLLSFDRFFKLAPKEVWREQQVDIVVHVPVGTHLYMSDNMQTLLSESAHSPMKLSGGSWIMTEEGLDESDDRIVPVPSPPDEKEEEEVISGHSASAHVGRVVGIFFSGFFTQLGWAV